MDEDSQLNDDEDSEDQDRKPERKNSGHKTDSKDPHFGKLELFIQGLSFNTDESSLRAYFEPFGTLTKCKVMKGKAFVEYESHENAVKAMKKTNDTSLDGRTINVEFSA